MAGAAEPVAASSIFPTRPAAGAACHQELPGLGNRVEALEEQVRAVVDAERVHASLCTCSVFSMPMLM